MTSQESLNAHGITLENYEPGQHYATCPECSAKRTKSHQKTKCLGVKIEANGRVVWHCNHCDWSGPPKGPETDRKIVPTHIYRDRDGVIRFGKVRNPPGAKIKCWFCHPDGNGGWAKKLGDADASVLYRIDEVTDAIEAGREIAIVEGEKDADNLWHIGIAATCNAHGASDLGKKPKWTAAHSEQLKGADIVVFNDNDAPGYAHADATCKLSLGVAKRVRRLDLKDHWPEIPAGGDVSDWLTVGGAHTPEQLRELIARAPEIVEPEKPEPPDDDAEIERLAKLFAFEYERGRAAAAKALGIRAGMLDKLVAAKRAGLGLDGGDGIQGHAVEYEEPEPWPEPVDGAQLLDEIAAAARRFVVLPKHGAEIVALWVVHTYCMDATDVTPRLQITAPEKGCGKSTLLDFLEQVVYRPDPAANISTAAFFRTVEQFRPTLLIDDLDSFAREDSDIRNVLNSGHHIRGRVKRIVGDNHEVRAFSTFAALAYNHIGELPREYNTLVDRSITIALARRLATETIESLSGPRRRNEFADLRRKLKRFANDKISVLANVEPEMPSDLINRLADNWRPLLAIADTASSEWRQKVLKAIAAIDRDEIEVSERELLLSHIREIFGRVTLKDDFISSTNLAVELAEVEGGPWKEYGRTGKPISTKRLRTLLKPLHIHPKPNAAGDARGYYKAHFEDAFARYLGPDSSHQADSGDSSVRSVRNPGETGTSDMFSKCQKGDFSDTLKSAGNAHAMGTSDASDTSRGENGSARVSHLSEAEIEELRGWLVEYDWRYQVGAEVLAQALHERLCNWYDVRPDALEAEAERVMVAAFG
jgi:putative DNA primase/helicase